MKFHMTFSSIEIMLLNQLSVQYPITNSLLWPEPDAVINAHDPMQISGYIQVFYKPGQICLTRTKHDLSDMDNPIQFQPWCILRMAKLCQCGF